MRATPSSVGLLSTAPYLPDAFAFDRSMFLVSKDGKNRTKTFRFDLQQPVNNKDVVAWEGVNPDEQPFQCCSLPVVRMLRELR